jgi:rod shape-determining protein MreD
MVHLCVWLAGFLFTLSRGVWTDPGGPGFLAVELVAVLTAYLFMHFDRREAALFAFGQGLFMDLWSAGPRGLHGVVYLVVLLVIALGSRFFNMQETKGQMTVLFASVVVQRASFFLLVPLFGTLDLALPTACAALSSAIVTGLAAPVVLHGMNRLRAAVAGEG